MKRSKFLSTEARQLSLMMLITMITQVVAIYKSSVTATNFGASIELDAYNFANNFATFFLTFVATGISTVVIPAYVKKIERKAIDTFLTLIFLGTGSLLLLTYAYRSKLVSTLTNRDNNFNTYVCSIMLITIFIQLLPALLSVTTAYYQSKSRFNLPKVILLVSNVAVVIILALWKSFTIYQYLYVLFGGVIFQFVVDLAFAIFYGFRFAISLDLYNIEFIKMIKIFLPTLFSTGIYKFNTMVDSLISSNLATGQLTIFSYANTIVGMVNALVIGNLTAYIYPKIVEKVSVGNKEGQKSLWSYSVAFHTVVCLIITGFISVGREFIGILYEHGQFSSEAADMMYLCMCIYIFGQQNNVIRDLIYRYFFAHGNTKTTVKNGCITSSINIVCSLVLSRRMGLYGIVFGSFIAGTYSLLGIIWRMKKKYGFTISIKPYIYEIMKTEVAMISTIIIIIIMKNFIVNLSIYTAFLLFGTLVVVIYCVLLFVFKSNIFRFIYKYSKS